ncbi:SGNH/GDSL hydrolase family protein [Nocardia macrotermitis]|uniref:Lipase n=1 Tax=Nocardia macrotermitis TaxID=2585198 RepID=A0A7K0CZ51_9NOCA|nr:SGNH/GDSL hydrolase family protein [Nocardia macrotermitis]MQY18222.1 Lipase [Nocardia macrotermitis]
MRTNILTAARSRLAGVVVAACATLLTVTVTGPAHADNPQRSGSELVVLGDSYTANGIRLDGDSRDCNHGPTAWPVQLSKLLKIAGTSDFEDVSCSGASLESHTAYDIVSEARIAAVAGAFGPRTKTVALQFGMNDTWGDSKTMLWTSLGPCVFNFRDGCGPEAAAQGRLADFRALTGQAYADRLREVVDYVRYYAPNARIVLVGYPELFPAHSSTVCTSVLGVGNIIQDRGAGLVDYLDRLQQAQIEAAKLLDLHFFDLRALTAGHGLCSSQPWLNGFFDPRADFAGIPFHPSAQGDSVTAQALNRWISQ